MILCIQYCILSLEPSRHTVYVYCSGRSTICPIDCLLLNSCSHSFCYRLSILQSDTMDIPHTVWVTPSSHSSYTRLYIAQGDQHFISRRRLVCPQLTSQISLYPSWQMICALQLLPRLIMQAAVPCWPRPPPSSYLSYARAPCHCCLWGASMFATHRWVPFLLMWLSHCDTVRV